MIEKEIYKTRLNKELINLETRDKQLTALERQLSKRSKTIKKMKTMHAKEKEIVNTEIRKLKTKISQINIPKNADTLNSELRNIRILNLKEDVNLKGLKILLLAKKSCLEEVNKLKEYFEKSEFKVITKVTESNDFGYSNSQLVKSGRLSALANKMLMIAVVATGDGMSTIENCNKLISITDELGHSVVVDGSKYYSEKLEMDLSVFGEKSDVQYEEAKDSIILMMDMLTPQ